MEVDHCHSSARPFSEMYKRLVIRGSNETCLKVLSQGFATSLPGLLSHLREVLQKSTIKEHLHTF